MRKVFKKSILLLIFVFLIIMLFSVKANASYSMDTVNMTASINENGSLDVKQKIKYYFTGRNYEVSIGIPNELVDKECESLEFGENEKKIDNSKYKVKNLKINEIYVEDAKDKPFKYTENGYGGMNNVYTIKEEHGMYIVKLYKSSLESNKTIVIDYTLEGICKNHNDYGELYYNFIGNEDMRELNIDLYLPKKNKSIFTWKHGAASGNYKIISNDHINYKFKNIRLGENVALRVLFDKKCISNSEEFTGYDAKDIIFKTEDKILESRNNEKLYKSTMYALVIILLMYGIVTFVRFKNKKTNNKIEADNDTIIKEYNEIVLACMTSERAVLEKDFIASVLNMLNKNVINLEIKDDKYLLSKNIEKEKSLSKIEKIVYKELFEKEETIDFKEFLNNFAKKGTSFEKLEKVQKEVESNIYIKKLNILKLKFLKALIDIGFAICSLVGVYLFLKCFISKVIDIEGYIFADTIRMITYLILPTISIAFMIINFTKVFNLKKSKDISEKKAYIVLGIFLLISIIVLAYTCLMPFSKYIFAAELLLAINVMILAFDNISLKLGLKDEVEILKINKFIKNIEEYFGDENRVKEDIESTKKYLPYEICLFNSKDVLKKVGKLDENDNLFRLIKEVLIKEE